MHTKTQWLEIAKNHTDRDVAERIRQAIALKSYSEMHRRTLLTWKEKEFNL